MKFEFAKYESEEIAKRDLERLLPPGTSLETVRNLMLNSNVKCFAVSKGALPCRYVQPSSSLVKVVWSLGFYFDAENKLTRIAISRGLTGP